MFELGYIIAIYSFGIFAVGLAGILNHSSVAIVTLISLVGSVYYLRDRLVSLLNKHVYTKPFLFYKNLSLLEKGMLLLILLQSLINLWGALAPEYGFDALWYHLTIPKIFIQNESIFFIPGGLFYYSVMSKLVDLLYIPPLLFWSEIGAKLVHYAFGLLTLFLLYRVAGRFFERKYALLSVLVFSSNLVFAWQSTTAYVDLGRTFYELLAFFAVIKFVETKKNIWLFEAGVLVGIASAVKFLSLGSVILFLFLIVYLAKKRAIRKSLLFITGVILPVIPWVLFSFMNTGKPFYPFFTDIYPVSDGISLSLIEIVVRIFSSLLFAPDPISPVYIATLPLLPFLFSKLSKKLKIVALYSIGALLMFAVAPQTGGGRFLLAYLPVLSLLSVGLIRSLKIVEIKTILTVFILAIALVTVCYRIAAQADSIPYFAGNITKDEYLMKKLNFSYGDYYPISGVLEEEISSSDRLLVMGIHNLYYVDVPFIETSYMQKGEWFNYILVRGELPEEYSDGVLVHADEGTGTNLYKKQGRPWIY